MYSQNVVQHSSTLLCCAANRRGIRIYGRQDQGREKDCDFLIICTEWREFWDPDITKLKKLKEGKIYDGRNILDQQNIIDANIEYYGIGR